MGPRKHSHSVDANSEAVCEEEAWPRLGPKKHLIAGKIGVQFITFFFYPEGLEICIEHQCPIILSIIY